MIHYEELTRDDLSNEELIFIDDKELSISEVYDGRGLPFKFSRIRAKEEQNKLIFGLKGRCGHRLKTRSGHCVICNPSSFDFQENYHGMLYDPSRELPGLSWIYIAISEESKLIKVGSSQNMEYRQKIMNQTNTIYM